MSERQEDKRARQEAQALAMRQQLWAGVDPAVIERWAGGVPSGFDFRVPGYNEYDPESGLMNDAMNWKPGRVMTGEEVQKVVGNVSNYTLEGQGYDVARYLADPRAAIKIENGQYVYRPEAVTGNDFQGIPKTGFWDNADMVSMLPLAAFAAGPFAASLGAAGGAAAAGGAEAAGAGAVGEFGASFAPTITPSTVAQSGLLYSGGSMPTVAGLSGVGGLTAEGMAALGAMGSAGAGLGAGTTGALGSLGLDAAGNIVSQGVNLANSATTAAGLGSTAGGSVAQTAAQQAAKTGLSKVLKDTLGIDVDSSTLDLIGKGLGLGLGVYGADKQADASKDLFNQYMGLGAPFREELKALNANPSSFYGSDIFQGALQQGSDALSRSLSAKVGNPILNPTALQEMQNYTTRGSLDAFNNRWNQLASAGQLGVSQSSSLGQQANAATGNTYNALGAGLQSVFGNQRDYAAEMMDLLNKREARASSGQSGNVFNLP